MGQFDTMQFLAVMYKLVTDQEKALDEQERTIAALEASMGELLELYKDDIAGCR